MSNNEQPFQIAVSEDALSLLKQKWTTPDPQTRSMTPSGPTVHLSQTSGGSPKDGGTVYDWRACVFVLRFFLESRWIGQ